MENKTHESENKTLEFIRELIRIAHTFGHDKNVFHQKIFDLIGIDSLKEKEIVSIGEEIPYENLSVVLRENRLSEKEFELCCLLRQGFSAKEISVILGLKNYRSVHVKQSRIKKKLKGEASEIIWVMYFLSLVAWIVLKFINYPGY